MSARLKALAKDWLARTLWAWDGPALVRKLRHMGVREGDTLMVHSSWLAHNGFRGKAAEAVAAFKAVTGPAGLLVMPSLSYHNMSTAEYLARGRPMDVRRTPSMMGLLSEAFRRSQGVHRSLSPSHPLVAWGADAEAFLAGHERNDEPFGPDSPFAQLLTREAWILGLDVPFASFTFTHHVEALTAHALPFPFYEAGPMAAVTIDAAGQRIDCRVKVISAQANRARREERLVAELERMGALHRARLGNTRLLLVRAQDVLAGVSALLSRGQHFFETGAAAVAE
jgi:aminoglycoside 3-N-acetyltransferase